MRMRFRGGRGVGDKGCLSTGESRGSGGNPPGTTAFWITVIGLVGGAAVRDLAKPDSRLRVLGQHLLHSGIKLFKPDKEVRLVEGYPDVENVNGTVEILSLKESNK
jgi:hypothetical protein